MMQLDPDKSLSDNLAANGYGHRPGDGNGRRVIFRLDNGAEIGRMDCFHAWDWLKAGAPEEV